MRRGGRENAIVITTLRKSVYNRTFCPITFLAIFPITLRAKFIGLSIFL